MKGIRFGNFHTYDDLSLILTSKDIGSPTVKTKVVDVEGADGVIDYTEYFGEVKYNNLKHIFNFKVKPANFLSIFSNVKNKLHGRYMRIILDDDLEHYYMGRVTVSSITNDKNIGLLSIECDCEPYKYKSEPTVITKSINGTTIITLTNSRKRVVPTITTTASMTIYFGDDSATIGAGTYTIPTLELVEGDNAITVSGTGNITFTYQEGEM